VLLGSILSVALYAIALTGIVNATGPPSQRDLMVTAGPLLQSLSVERQPELATDRPSPGNKPKGFTLSAAETYYDTLQDCWI
jgi:hypothetical protein